MRIPGCSACGSPSSRAFAVFFIAPVLWLDPRADEDRLRR